MKVVGLLSGGKDSCYNLIHCVQQGHELIALATLAPPGSKDELDSYMYQTVGHDAVHLVAEAMELPLYRRVIKGTAINQRSEYGSRTAPSSSSASASTSAATVESLQDETEDLYHLLMDVKSEHPDVEAVSVGAILSNYQRVRVEHVALRPDINLTPLTFLWQRSQSELYAEMLQAGLVSILIKVAGIGLDERDLGKTLGQMQTKLERLSAMYGAHVCGEGGEYETLTIDSPLFKRRIDVGETETVVHSDGGGFGSVSYLKLKNAKLVEKDVQAQSKATTPPLLDAVGRKTLKAIQTDTVPSDREVLSNRVKELQLDQASVSFPAASIRRKGRYLVLSNITGFASSSPPTTPEDQVKNAFHKIHALLSTSNPALDMQHITHINLFLRSQTLFAQINSIYRIMFGVSPPTRACVALPQLPAGCDLVINAVAFDDTNSVPPFDRRALHVQGRSFWAPANIGPYSQSLVQAEKVWIAGQIGLVPADLILPREEDLQTALSIQHARRIFKATMNDMGGRSVEKGWVEGGICWVDAEDRVEVARRAWVSQCEGNDDDEGGEMEEERWLGKTCTEGEMLPPMLFVVLPRGSLPRSAAIEWQITAHTGRVPPPIEPATSMTEKPPHEDDDDDDDHEPGSDATDDSIQQFSTVICDPHGAPFKLIHTITSSLSAKSTFGILTLRRSSPSTQANKDDESPDAFSASIQACVARSYATQLFTPTDKASDITALNILQQLLSQSPTPDTDAAKLLEQLQVIPCSSIHTLTTASSDQHVDLAFIWHGI
ncbi:endoribonuclease [Pseudozyma hubeiensis SY62]|uniref:Diphthine--ammonia ligase n=1 Tax=Pseudozyma hubeiensis (strain SY62) TaxID=1305764 RepID=R9P3S5_PSEHS|nr:endoribonuclease [Pseudozyma hubeiensis SY62]GAC95882.1 endoribonuclease [Pseudozyma hubeiensis SY62]